MIYRLRPHILTFLCLIVIAIAACTGKQSAESCPSGMPVGLLDAQDIASNDNLPFRFPLDQSSIDDDLYFGWFGVSNECPPEMEDCFHYKVRLYHAAEDYKRPARTPVYAMADGKVSFSGRAGGYGWLIIIDHPQANLYSLYGHLSPSRWRIRSGIVNKGDIIAYLGDPDENGGSAEQPLEPHLHFGVGAGQKSDYPGRGDWRYQAGWIRPCPQDLGWQQPSVIITGQKIPAGRYPSPAVDFWVRWAGELLITGLYATGGAGMLIFGVLKHVRWMLLAPGILMVAAEIVFHNNGMATTWALLGIGLIVLVTGVVVLSRNRSNISMRIR